MGNGINSIALSVVNTYNDNITNLALDYNEDKLPSWLTVSTVVQDINVSKGMKSQEKLLLVMNVIDASDDESYELPFVLRDSHGNQWDYILPVHVRSNIAAFDVLHENYPNPFNPSTTIKYGLKEDRHTSLVIYNSLGQKVRTLIDQPQTAGIHAVRWDGKNDAGLQVSSGLYIYRLVSGQFSQTRRMILLD
ncbi:MAG: T9SS type A sorting domain-containing protein [Candidatus Latescibacteria bacterium]|nr:T9SS type A sorting domain-containing protein [Candidatus Latescibacterota bacterium]